MEDKKSESDSESDSEDFKSFTLPNPITPLKPPSRLGISRHDHKRRSIPNLATFDTSPKEMKKEGHKKKVISFLSGNPFLTLYLIHGPFS